MGVIIPVDNDDLLFVEEFLNKKFKSKLGAINEITYNKLSRVGYSGVSIYIIDYLTTATGAKKKKVIFKIARRKGGSKLIDKLTNEEASYKEYVYNTLDHAPTAIEFYENSAYAGIAYPYKSFAEANTLNLHELFQQAFIEENSGVPDAEEKIYNEIKTVITAVYKVNLKKWMNDYQIISTDWNSQYDWYLRWERSKKRILSILNCENEDQEYVFYNERKFHNPVNVITKIKSETNDFITRVIHGDLHQRNILLNGKDHVEQPWIIDFEWTKGDMHFLVDYALLECSIKFQYLTSLMVDNEIFTFEKCLNNHLPNPPFKYRRIKELYIQISNIRALALEEYMSACKKLKLPISESKFQSEYLRSVILMTTGLLGVSNFEEVDKRGLVSSLIFLCNEYGSNTEISKKLNEIGETSIVRKYIFPAFKNDKFPQIYIDKGDDCSAFSLREDSNLVIASTDPCPLPVAWLLGDLDFSIYGWYSVLINLSDLASMGAAPIGIQLSVEMPEDMHIIEFEKFLSGVKEISELFSCPIIGGNVKDGSRFLSTGTIFGETSKHKLLLRNQAHDGDYIIVIGTMGLFWSAILDYNDRLYFSDNEIYKIINRPIPRVEEGLLLVENRLTSCGMDSSDGLISCFYEIAGQSGVDFYLDFSLILESLDQRVIDSAKHYGINHLVNIALSWGEWQLVTTISPNMLPEFQKVFKENPYHILGKVIAGDGHVRIHKEDVDYTIKDFGSKRFNSNSYFSNGLDAYKEYLKNDFLSPI
ncbi:thiamine-phosphate kinase [Mucilaginibacter sp. dw_454]|uniref:thiamine-phosphate kinase n=1 Tax=Mucilaginibacter sp. dw_454 TaxID=2720079 RepID=UPI001BD31929|nr:thiamine-phosphate kinase [Mucilaginibacter sp. dw_454]